MTVSLQRVEELSHRVRSCLGNLVRQFEVQFDGDGLILRGTTQTYHAKQLAQHEVMKATSLRILANEITVQKYLAHA